MNVAAHDSGLAADLARPNGDRLDGGIVWQLVYRLPIIAAVNGAHSGTRLSLVLFCDLRFVAADGKLTTAALELGLPAEYGSSWRLPRLVGVCADQRPPVVGAASSPERRPPTGES